MRAEQMDITRYLLHCCYNCDDAGNCTTEEACRQCWLEHGLLGREIGEDDTKGLLQAYYQ
ncbi:hypothetical protein PA598K_02644 [Paenibacillus sp. 598K]|uniref:hypothetical protein n=1 Tax=Paenibacillus sp. 598K TaxID=1117987 RepID=UPI000FFA34C8|nr:hypothetical protein [Paenibacillus sp. 598K]GBF74307.1 hypothetical protein PA598K_02644 [Paenibacillus sp. 598K]